MSTYALNDFSESLSRVTLPAPPAEVLRSWGESAEGPGCDWSGGFIMRLQNGQFAYLSGWCDYTGWGCQDGAHLTIADSIEALDLKGDHQEPRSEDSWDEQPADLNRWIAAGMLEDGQDTHADIGIKAAQ